MRARCAAVVAMVAASLLFAPPAGALDPERSLAQYKHTSWTTTEGAPPIIYALAQSTDGYLWIGSASGLYRFDGVTFEHIAPHGPEANAWRATALLVARDGTIWAGYHGGDIATYRDGVLRPDRSAPRTDAYVLSLVQTRDGAIWATVYRRERSLLRYFQGRWQEIGADWGLPAGWPANTLATRDGSLWLTDDVSILRLRPGARRFERVQSVTSNGTISEDLAGRIWRSDSLGSRIIPGAAGESSGPALPTPSFPGWPAFVYFDRDGNLWGLNGRGVFRARVPREVRAGPPGGGLVEHFTAKDGLSADTAALLFEDREGNIWVATTLGLDQFRAASVMIEPMLAGRPPFGSGLLGASDGTVYVGTSDAVYRVAPGGAPRLLIGNISEPSHICEAADGSIWIFTLDRALRLRQNRITATTIPVLMPSRSTNGSFLGGCAVDRDGTLWLNGKQSGMFSTKSGEWHGHGAADPDLSVDTMVRGSGGSLLALLNSGNLVRLGTDGKPERILLRRKPSEVNVLYQGRHDVLLGGSFGLGRLQGGTLQIADPTHFPWLADPNSMAETPQGQIWLFGRAGIVGLPAADLERAFRDPRARLEPTVLGFEDGLPNVRSLLSQPGVVRGGDGRLWFATVGGVVWIDPARLAHNRLPPPVHIRGLVAGDVRYRDPRHLKLVKGTSNLAIQYTGLSLTMPQRVRFRYRLEGVDADWIEAGTRREAYYTNLGPGTYRFRVVAANNDGVWNRAGATLDFTIPPTFLQSIWFKLLCALALGALALAAYALHVQQLKARLQSHFEVRIAERERIARELHDTLLQSVQGLVLFVQSIGQRIPPDSDLRQPIEKALDRADAALDEGRARVRDLRSNTASHDLAQALYDTAAGIVTGETPS
ncbi:MAG TPA: triple tyrosine motif-containing protein, partial [Rhizomicrobium sp.]